MKIAILTLPLQSNYGGILQAYALQRVLSRKGHQVDVLNREPRFLPFRPIMMPLLYAKRLLRKLRDKKTIIFMEHVMRRERETVNERIDRFINDYLPIRIISSFKEIRPQDYDAIIVGSDQVWRPIYFKKAWEAPITNAFLDFTKRWHLKRIAYAASFGIDNPNEFTSKELISCRNSLKLFNSVSVREKSGVKLCESYFDVNPSLTLDPTLLLEKEDYISLVKKAGIPKNKGNLLCYILDSNESKSALITRLQKDLKLIPFKVNIPIQDRSIPAEKRVLPGIEEWISGFMDAEMIVTDSFHACVFSIIFGKPFVVVGNKERGMSRFISLLNLIGISEDMISMDSSHFHIIRPDENKIKEELCRLKESSLNFISQSLQ